MYTGRVGGSQGEEATVKGKCSWKKNNSKDIQKH